MDEKNLVIENEDQAWQIFEGVLQHEIVVDEETALTFKGWPVIEFAVKGRRWQSSVPTRVMPPILDIQKNLHRAYCRVHYGETDL